MTSFCDIVPSSFLGLLLQKRAVQLGRDDVQKQRKEKRRRSESGKNKEEGAKSKKRF